MSLLNYLLHSVHEKYLSLENPFDSRIAPKNLIKELENKSMIKKFVKLINKPTSDPLKVVRRLHVCHLLLMYSDLCADEFLSSLHIPVSTDQWVND
jgi:hypothetical protein